MVRLWNLMICKKILSKIFPYAQFENVFLKILNFTHSRRRAILNLERTPSFEKQSTRFFFFLNMHILKTSNGWRSCPLSIGWMNGLLDLGPWGNWESLRAQTPGSGLFIEDNLRPMPLVGEIFFFFFFEVKNVNNKFKQTFLW